MKFIRLKVRFLYIGLFNVVAIYSSFAQTTTSKQDYLQVIQRAEEIIWRLHEESVIAWSVKPQSEREKDAPKAQLHWGRLNGLLYSLTGEIKYAQRARRVLLESPWYDNYYAISLLKQIDKSTILSKTDLEFIHKKILTTAEENVRYWVEWGTMNHCSDIVNGLTAVMHYFPQHVNFPRWKQKRDIGLSANWSLWSIEDSHNYIPPWMKPLMQSVELDGQEDEFYAMPTVKYYFDYSVQLIRPDGQVAEFGDGGSGGEYTWCQYVAMLEKGATTYRDGKMKWAAHRIFESNVHGKGQAYIYGIKDLVDAYLWSDDSVSEEIPSDKSRLVLEDYVGKKVVFRSGWEQNATYLLLNYLEDAPFGLDGKEHIINTINVETEKNHHGHADENAISLLMKNGSVLLHDSGYREIFGTGPDGQYRADTFHNKMLVRNGIADPQTRLFPFLLDGGQCRLVKTKLMHFRQYEEVDVSRTRVTDEQMGYQWDRLISYLKGKEWFVIFDIVKILKQGPYTLANIFYTQDIMDFDPEKKNWYDTRYRTVATTLQSGGFAKIHPSQLLNPSNYIYFNDDNARLLMFFPEGDLAREGIEQLQRCYQNESAIYRAKSDTMKAGEIFVSAVLLIPHSPTENSKAIMASLSSMKVYRNERGYGIKIPTEEGFIQINAMLDLEAEYLLNNVRPRYNFESGRAEYGEWSTDARYCYLHQQKNDLYYAFYSATKLVFDNQTIFNADGQLFAQDDGGSQRWGVPKWVAWEERINLPKK